MPLLSTIKDYAKRYRKSLMVTAAIGGGSYLLGRYVANKLRDLQEKAMTERVAKENLKRRFQQNQNDCVFTVLSLLPTLGDQILYEMNVEAAWTKLQESRKLEKQEERLRKEREARKAAENKEVDKKEEPGTANVEAASTEDKTPATTTGEKIGTMDTSVSSLEASGISEEKAPTMPEGVLDKKAKYLLWEEIKTIGFTRTLTAIYSVTLLTLLIHIQLNLLGRFTYVWSVSMLNRSEPTIRLQHADEEPEGGFVDPETERIFLSASWWLLHRGWRMCAERVKQAVEDVVGSIPLKRIITYEDADNILQQLRRRVEYEEDGVTPTNYCTWMLPDSDKDTMEYLKETGFAEGYPKNDWTSKINLQRLLDETKDYIDSPDFSTVLSACLDEVFAIFDHQAFAKSLLPVNATVNIEQTGRRIHEVKNNADALAAEPAKKVTLANLLPSISRQAHLVIAGNEYLNAFAYIKELQAFSAMIYTQYGEEVNNN